MKRLLHHTRSLFYNSQLWSAGADIGKQELKELISKPAIRILDVRTREEHGSGFIPTATNIPVDEITDALQMKQIDFQKKYGFEKPRKDQMLVVYCKAGVRAQKAMDIAKQLGYPQVRNYRGSWLDWTSSQ